MKYNFVERSSCPSCGSGATTTEYHCRFDEAPISDWVRGYYEIDPQDFASAPYELSRCRDCDLLFQRWVGDAALLGELYGVWLDKGPDLEADPQFRLHLDNPLLSRDGHEILAASSFLGIPPEKLVTLDYGMGWALWARIAVSLGCRSYGFDLSPNRMDYARSHGVRLWTPGDGRADMFDFINTEQVFEHVTAPLEVARTLARALKPGGILKISVPSGNRSRDIVEYLKSAQGPLGDEIVPVIPLEHINCFPAAAAKRLGASVGLVPVRPGLRHLYAFLRRRSTLDPRRPKTFLKEMVRPVYQFRSRSNLYLWLRKQG